MVDKFFEDRKQKEDENRSGSENENGNKLPIKWEIKKRLEKKQIR